MKHRVKEKDKKMWMYINDSLNIHKSRLKIGIKVTVKISEA